MQVTQNIPRNLWLPQGHRRANRGVKHPCWKGRYDTRLDLDMDDASASALLAVVNFYATPVEGVPAVVNYNFMPDMGRMTA
jgi:hypothetical protein